LVVLTTASLNTDAIHFDRLALHRLVLRRFDFSISTARHRGRRPRLQRVEGPAPELNEDYKPLHALCRFFLAHSGPSHEMGSHTMLPFLVDTARLYELFIAEWLKTNLPRIKINPPRELYIVDQEPVHFDSSGTPHFDIDLVLYDAAKTEALCVLDTKYKVASTPTSNDLAQVVAYAEAKRCNEAILVYPGSLSAPLDTKVGDIRVRSLSFSVSEDLDEQGYVFVQEMIHQGSEVSAHG
jgi:5-methylcytosine-specific restriction enzyme subunit McrC